jgi:polar amino acid transport system ATP-binding protein
MHEGRIAEEGDPKELFRNPRTERLSDFLKNSRF